MRTLTLRRWLALSLISIFVVPVILFNMTVLAVGGAGWWTSVNRQTNQQTLDQATTIVGSDPGSWSDASWQRSAASQLSTIDVGAQLYDSRGDLIGVLGDVPSSQHRSGPWWGADSGPSRVVVLRGNGQQTIGTVDLFDTGSTSHQPFLIGVLAGFAGLGLALIGSAWLLGHYVVRPLEAASRAAHQIAAGDLDISVPPSRVSEVDQVSAAFRVMGTGLRTSIERQAELEEERRFFVAAIAHDLRTPLFSLRGYLQGLKHGVAHSPEKVSQYIDICVQKADQIERLVTDLFAFTRAEQLEQTLRFEPVEVEPLIAQSIDDVRLQASEKDVHISVDAPAITVAVRGDTGLLERVLVNLLDNAVRHSPTGGTIEIIHRVEGDRLLISVADAGPGIQPHDLPHLFEPFFRSDTSRNSQTGGAGLGLSIARRIVRAHGGDLTAENRPAGGALFVVSLPLKMSQADAAGVEQFVPSRELGQRRESGARLLARSHRAWKGT